MLVREVTLGNYRNYRNLHLNFDPSLNIFVGKNAQGKTNLLEAIFYALTGKSHRTVHDKEVISWGELNSKIILKGERDWGKVLIEIVIRDDGKKILKVNNQVKKKLSELLGIIKVVLFSPEDMQLIKGGPGVRRKFLDIEISQINPIYFQNLVDYNKVIAQRNMLLKAIRDKHEKQDLLDVWDDQLLHYGLPIIRKRQEVVKKMKEKTNRIHQRMTQQKEKIDLIYLPSVKISSEAQNEGEIFFRKLKENRRLEIIRGITLYGPHKDDLLLLVDGKELKTFGSQGQQRTCALSLKLSEIELFKDESGEYPILLLDDVMSELDLDRRQFLLKIVAGRIQTFITSTGLHDLFEPMPFPGSIFKVTEGQVTKQEE